MSFRINSSNHNSNSINLESQGAPDKAKAEFNNILAQTRKIQGEELNTFLAKLDKQGQKLAESLSLQDLVEFKKMLKTFLKSTFGQSRNMHEESLWDFRGQPKVMARVTKIDQVLEELGQQVMDCHTEPLKILAKIDEIRGLLIDLFG